MHRKKITATKLISLFFSFLIALALFSSSIFMILQTTFFNYKFALQNMRDSGYYTTLAAEIENEFKALGSASGFDNDIFSNIIPRRVLEDDVNKYILDVYSNKDVKIDTSKLVSSLDKTFMEYANQKGVVVTEKIQHDIQTLENKCASVYSNHIDFMFANQVSLYFNKLGSVSMAALVISILFALILGVVIFLINRWKHIAIRNYIYAISACILMLLPIPIIGFASHKIEKIGITAKHLYDFVVLYFNNILYHFIYIILFWVIILGLCIFLYIHKRNAVTKHRH